jgi:hypothetical protein
MSASIKATTPMSSQSVFVRKLLRERCTTAIKVHLPQKGLRFGGTLGEESIGVLMAVFELQRVELQSELDDQHINNSVISDVIYELSTGSYLSDHQSSTLLVDMESHLRLLASALRLYKYHGKSLDQQIYQDIYRGMNKLSEIFENNRQWRDDKLKIEELNVAFLLKHCFCLLQSIDSTDCLDRAVARRAILAFDGTVPSFQAPSYQALRSRTLEAFKRQMLRLKWHEEYLLLEDACWSIFGGDVRGHSSKDTDIQILQAEALAATGILRESIETHVSPQRQESRRIKFMRNSKSAQDVYDEFTDLHYGILDLLYQLSFRMRKRSRAKCFLENVKLIRYILEQCSPVLRPKATDLWNRILELGDQDRLAYGEEDDRHAIHRWINEHLDDSEAHDHSALYTLRRKR